MTKRPRIPECVKLQDRGALAIYEITKDMTREEELAYWAEQTAALRRKQAALCAERQRKAS
jgi:hypothetical protein